MTSPQSASGTQQLEALINLVVEFQLFPGIPETLLYGMYTLLICLSSAILIRRGFASRPIRLMFAATVVMYTMSATHWALGVQSVRNEYNNGHPLLLFLDRKRERHRPRGEFHATTTILFVQLLVAIVNIILSDIIVLWRASVIWSRNVFVVAISIAFVITIPVFYIISITVGVLAYLNEIQHVVVVVFFAVAFVLSLVSNICATMLITYKAWLLRRRIGKYLQNAGRGSAVEGVMALLVESGALYCAIWLIGIVSGFASGSREFFICFVASIAQITGMYPTLIIVIVALEKSPCEHQFTYSASSAPPRTEVADVPVPAIAVRVLGIQSDSVEAGDSQLCDREKTEGCLV